MSTASTMSTASPHHRHLIIFLLLLCVRALQLVGGIFGTIYFSLGLAGGTTAAINRAYQQGLPVPNQAYILALNSIGLLTGILQLVGGIIGIQATADIHRVLALDPAIVKKARTYWIIYTTIYVISLVTSSVTTGLATAEVYNTYGQIYSDSQIASAVFWIWANWVFVVLIQFYFVFVVFSYMKTLELAAAGNLGSLPFVVKNQYPTGHPAASPAHYNQMPPSSYQQQVPPPYYAEGQPVQQQGQPLYYGAPPAASVGGAVELPKV